MTKDKFRELFRRVLEVAAKHAGVKVAKQIPRSFSNRLRAFGYDDRLISVDEAAGFEVAVLVGRDVHGLENRKKGDADGFR